MLDSRIINLAAGAAAAGYREAIRARASRHSAAIAAARDAAFYAYGTGREDGRTHNAAAGLAHRAARDTSAPAPDARRAAVQGIRAAWISLPRSAAFRAVEAAGG